MEYYSLSKHSTRTSWLCFFIVLYPMLSLVTSLPGNETDKLALLAFKDRVTQDPLGVMSSWNDSTHFCYWQGVSCSKRHFGRVTALHLEKKMLVGTLPPQIGNLSFLKAIILRSNFFGGEIPREVGHLSRLQYLNLSSNVFQGEIPTSLSNCSNLIVIELLYNNLVGEIPFELSFLAEKDLRGFSNNLTGNIPNWLGNATSLQWLSLGGNNLQGTIPSELGRLSNLRLLQVGINNLSGTVPPSIYNLSSLQGLGFADNQLHGTIPADVGSTLYNLVELALSTNHFGGLVPASLSNASRLQGLSIGKNNFTGTVPLSFGKLQDLTFLSFNRNNLKNKEEDGLDFLTSLTNCSKLQDLDIGFNKFSGELPSSIANFSSELTQLFAGYNHIRGAIPEGIETLSSLQVLLLAGNMITGQIPSGIGTLSRLGRLELYYNRISGVIPFSIGNLTQLITIDLAANALEGQIPPSIDNCQQLQILRLEQNSLIGPIPKGIGSLSSSIFFLNLSQNSVTGELPSTIGNMTKVLRLDMSENMLYGDIPVSIGNCEMLEGLFLRDNSFGGFIPSTLNNLKSIHALDLSNNNLSGRIPSYLQSFTFLQYLNLSYNNLEGDVPKEGIFKTLSQFSIVGNEKLCGGEKGLGLPTCQSSLEKNKALPLVLKIIIPTVIASSILIASLCFIGKRARKSEEKSSSIDLVGEQFLKVSYAELSRATNGFSSSNLIGEGSYGSVYRGILGSSGKTVAIKVLNLTQKGAAKTFIAECNVPKNISHRNLIKLITVCSSIDFKGEDFKALVFEWMTNGNLEEWLNNGEFNHKKLNLAQRVNVAIDVAFVLEYLHHSYSSLIVHGDLKPSNILFDHEMIAHIGDFGLASIVSNYQGETTSRNPTSSSGLKGTIGYVAPEYGLSGKATLEGDLYSFGIMLLEIFTGIKLTADIFKNGMNLHRHIKMALPDNIHEIVEPSILLDDEVDGNHASTSTSNGTRNMVKNMECVAAILRIGISCSMASPSERMKIKDVVVELNKIKKEYIQRQESSWR